MRVELVVAAAISMVVVAAIPTVVMVTGQSSPCPVFPREPLRRAP